MSLKVVDIMTVWLAQSFLNKILIERSLENQPFYFQFKLVQYSFSHYIQVFKNRNECLNRERVRNLHQKSISGDTSWHRPTIEIRTSPPFEIQRYFNGHYRAGSIDSFFFSSSALELWQSPILLRSPTFYLRFEW